MKGINKMYIIIQVTNNRKTIKIFPKVYDTFEKAEVARKQIFLENGGQKSGWVSIVTGKQIGRAHV